MAEAKTERVNTLVIGGGQAGLSVGYHLARHGVPFLILDGSERIGDAWRQRWDSLHLFTPAKLAGLDGLRFPAPPNSFPTKDAMADYLELYARTFALPVRSGVRVNRLSRLGDRFVAVSGARRFEADHVIVAMANYQRPRVPPFARDFDARSCSSTPSSTDDRLSCRRVTRSWSARVIQAPKSPSRSHESIGPGWRALIPATSRFASTASRHASCSRA
jgi:thioredoxin reductase